MRLPRNIPLDRLGLSVVRHHFYEPIFNPRELPDTTWEPREPVFDMHLERQLTLLREFRYGSEIDGFFPQFGPGDVEILHSVIRHFRPKRIIEIGSGHSTLVALKAEAINDNGCKHTCIEPYMMPWLESTSAEVIRNRVEDLPLGMFGQLEAGDILFIDSSHVLRTGGDVYFEYLKLLPSLNPGVLIHVHDIFFPFDYPRDWIVKERRFWTEQYLLEAFLAFNCQFQALLALNYLKTYAPNDLYSACQLLSDNKEHVPGSFWMQRCY